MYWLLEPLLYHLPSEEASLADGCESLADGCDVDEQVVLALCLWGKLVSGQGWTWVW